MSRPALSSVSSEPRLISLAFIVVFLAVLPRLAFGATVDGIVQDREGKPLAGVLARLQGGFSDASAISAFSGEDGRFQVVSSGEIDASKIELTCMKLGYEAEKQVIESEDGQLRALCVLKGITNVAKQVPASAWLADFPDEPGTYRTVLLCEPCHQFPFDSSHGLLSSLEGEPKEFRVDFWKSMIDRMRDRALEIGPEGSALANPEMASVLKELISYALFNEEDEKVLSETLAAHVPTDFENYPLEKALTLRAPLGVTPKTYIKEYQLEKRALVREVMMTPSSPYVWGADVKRNRILRLDPRNNEVKWIDFPYHQATGPHTIDRDAEGAIWVSTIENDMVARIDPETEEMKVWKWPEGSGIHDFAQNGKYEIGFDKKGRFWVTLPGKNQVASFNPKTGEKQFIDVPTLKGENPIHTQIYGASFSPNGLVWFCQLMGGVGAVNTDTGEVEHYLEFPLGTGPRRPTVTEDGTLYVPLYGAGQLLAVNTETGKEIGRYNMPDRANGPYVTSWDPSRRVVWVGTSASDVLYTFNPKTGKWAEFPLPRDEAFIRKLFVHPETGDVWTTYATIPDYRGPSMVVVLHPGDDVGTPASGEPAQKQAKLGQ